MLIAKRNLNESPEHYELKQIAKYLLWSLGYRHVATEVGCCNGRDIDFPAKCFHKNTIDTIGAKTKGWYRGVPENIKIMGFEAKASLSDFRNGFCTACEYTYIIAPKGVIPVTELPPKIGLVEVDLKNYTIGTWGGVWYRGIEIVRVARSRRATAFSDAKAYQDWALEQFRAIAYRASVENVFRHAEIVLETRSPREIMKGGKKSDG